jgi:hypothetical protein
VRGIFRWDDFWQSSLFAGERDTSRSLSSPAITGATFCGYYVIRRSIGDGSRPRWFWRWFCLWVGFSPAGVWKRRASTTRKQVYNRQLSELLLFRGAGRKARVERNECQRQVSCWSPDCSGHDVANIRVTQRWPNSGHRCGSVSHDRGNLGDLRAAVCEAKVMFRGIGSSRCKSSTTKDTKFHEGFPEWFPLVRLRVLRG